MAPRPLNAVLLLIAAAAILGPVWAVFVFKPAPYSLAGAIPGPTTLTHIETIAETACRCTRARHGKERGGPCWNDFDKTVAPYQPSEYAIGCGVTGTEGICFGKPDGDQTCIVIDRSPRGECNEQERRIIAAIWPPGEPYYEDPAKQAQALEADRRAHEAFERGDKLHPPAATAGGCGAGLD